MTAELQGQEHASERSIGPKQIAIGVLGILAVVFIFQNTGKGKVHFLWFDITAPAWLWLIVVFLIGGAVGWIIRVRRDRR